jgi:hypothetical protein
MYNNVGAHPGITNPGELKKNRTRTRTRPHRHHHFIASLKYSPRTRRKPFPGELAEPKVADSTKLFPSSGCAKRLQVLPSPPQQAECWAVLACAFTSALLLPVRDPYLVAYLSAPQGHHLQDDCLTAHSTDRTAGTV